MAEILVKFDEPIAAPNGNTYFAQAAGEEVEGGLWHGWLEFQAVDDASDALVSGRETTQPNRTNLEYWAQGLTKIYLEGALDRAISLAEPRKRGSEHTQSPLCSTLRPVVGKQGRPPLPRASHVPSSTLFRYTRKASSRRPSPSLSRRLSREFATGRHA